MIGPTVQELTMDYPELIFLRVNQDTCGELGSTFHVHSIPVTKGTHSYDCVFIKCMIL
ncbi:hypothetical protein C0J52_14393 [Blattella germanica]|nr:hypothetical protein C0J52_14393 [Blattella germanica]